MTGTARSDLAWGVTLALTGAAVLWFARDLPSSPYEPLGPAFLPRVVAGVLVLLSVLLVVQSAIALHRSPTPEADAPPMLPAVAGVALLAGFVAALQWRFAPFEVSAALFMIGVGMLIGPRVQAWRLVAFSIAAAVGLAFVCRRVLLLDLP